MQTDTAAEFLIRKIRQKRERIVENLARGMDYQTSYFRAVGQVEGLDYAIALINDTAKRVANDEELKDDE
jgi:hypothetical protein